MNIKNIIKKNKEVINYLIFGVLTTIVNYVVYIVMSKVFKADVIISTSIAWACAVAFAYITNKIYVFESKTSRKRDVLKEIFSFVSFRAVSGIMDIVFMYITVTIFGIDDLIMKLASNVVIVIINYVFSKLFIFKKVRK